MSDYKKLTAGEEYYREAYARTLESERELLARLDHTPIPSVHQTVISFIAYTTPIPQGSMKAYLRGKRAILTSDNPKMKPCRSEVTARALDALSDAGVAIPMAAKHVPVNITVSCYFLKPDSARKREKPSVRPDIDKLARLVLDSLTGVIYTDDAQVVNLTIAKQYGSPERIEVCARAS